MFFNQNKEDVVKALGSSSINGLSDEEVSKRQASYGLNQLSSQKKQSIVVKFLLQFIDPLIILLLVAALVSIIVDPGEWVDSLIILIVVIFNAVLGVYQENSAEKSLEALKRLSAPSAKVIRNGERLTIDAKELTVGDIVIIEAGDYIPSDGRIIEAYNLQIDESSLTGESIAVNKNTDIIEDDDVSLADQKNMAFASTVCTYGRGKMIITSVGMNNEVGKIANMLQENSDQNTPLQLKMAQISKVIGIMCVLICVIVFGLEWLNGESVLVAFKTAVALAVAAIPEGLATVVTIVLSIGVTKMVKNNAIVKKLPAVETLGSANVVCSDKTGTLTQNKMTVVKTYLPEYGIKKFDDHEHADDVKKMLRYFTLCSDAELKIDNGEIVLFGDPTETAMVYASYLLNDTKENLYQEYKRTCELSFDSKRKMMSVFYETKDGIYSFTKGAPDEILRRSNNVNKKDFAAYEQMADEALRVLAVGIKKWDSIPDNLSSDNVENDLSFIGMIGMIDPPRVEVKAAINEAKMGGIVTVMITGDHITTAKAIASELGILTADKKAITGKQLDEMDDDTLDKEIANIGVYARVAPEHKVRIVKAWQRKNAVVAMTGDGVNDSPALKAADIGCAMGITGTDVSKESADMILTDDNFATII
ncbi:MAG: HAD-IC family P-type ATPase, partial [Erysipelotrichaceae bacterium]|nr:HAD-IC family P-type ATPase [Erysipelotrichaceae bacterium]